MKLKNSFLILIWLHPFGLQAQWNPINGGYNYSGGIGIGSTMTSLSGALHVNGINSTGWSYFSGNVNGSGNPQNLQGLALGWNRSGGGGESSLIYNTSLGSMPRLDFSSYNGSGFNQEMTLWNGKLGIGVTNPQERLHVTNGAIMAADLTFNSINVKIDGTSVPIIKFTRWTGGGSEQHNAYVGQFYNSAAGSEYSLGFGTGRSYTGVQNEYTNRMTILTNGAVGIGTNTPQENLHLLGNNQETVFRIENSNIGLSTIASVKFKNGNSSSIWQTFARNGDFFVGIANVADYMVIKNGGNIGVGTSAPDAKLSVKGQVHAQEVKVDLNGAVAPDYVFEPTYSLSPLDSIKSYLDKNKHLPEVPSAATMEKEGIKLGEMNMLLLKKIEELTLYVIEQNKTIQKQNERIISLENTKQK